MPDLIAFATRAAAEAAEVVATVTSLRIDGYHMTGDGGAGIYVRTDGRPDHPGRLRTADGAWWEIGGAEFTARQFGARGDGVADDSASLQAALDCPKVLALRLPAGRYRAVGLKLRRACAIIGEAAELFWGEPADRDLLQIDAPEVSVRSLTLRGVRYVDTGTGVAPHTLLRIDPRQAQDQGEVRLQDVTFIGGLIGCVIGLVSNVFIDRVRFERCRDYALVLNRGPRKIVINGLIASEIGGYGAIKTGLAGTERATERLVVNDFVVSDCGRIEADPGLWQEGIDLVCGFARELVVSNGVISNCGNGGIELKTGSEVFLDEDDQYEDILITGVAIAVTGNVHGIVLNWHGGKTNREKRGRRIMIADNIIRHQQATATGASGIHVSAWSDLHIVNNFIDGAHQGIVIAPVGSSDDSARNLRIAGNRIGGVQTGISARSGFVQDLDVSGNAIDCRRSGVALAGSTCRGVVVAHNRIRHAGDPGQLTACIQVRDAHDVEIWNNRLISEHGAALLVYDGPSESSSGLILKNVVSVGREAFQVRSGEWEIFDNFVRAEPARRTWVAAKPAAVSAAWNLRGLRSAAPKDRGSAGDLVLHAKRPMVLSTAPLGWWADTAMPDSPAAWIEIGGAAAPRKPTPEGLTQRLRGHVRRVAKALRGGR